MAIFAKPEEARSPPPLVGVHVGRRLAEEKQDHPVFDQ